jgi:MOSC domain-containing protein YiiM
MKIVSLNVGRPRLVVWEGRTVSTGIFKAPVAGRVALRTLNLDGDRQADLTVHGGAFKAAYAYPSEHYAYWRGELPGAELGWGAFGENFTTEGFDESGVRVGDRFRVGSAEVTVTTPRMPCYKLAARFGRADMVKRFLASGLCGFYFSVRREGEVGAGDRVELLGREEGGLTVAEAFRLYSHGGDAETLRRAVAAEALPESWRERFRQQLARVTA